MSPPSRSFTVQLTESEVAAGRIAFDAYLHQYGSGTVDRTGLARHLGRLFAVGHSPESPDQLRQPMKAPAWFAGQAIPGIESLTQSFEFDARKGTLAVERDGRFEQVQTSGQRLQPGTHTLAVRLQRANREVALIPVMEFSITSSGKVSYRTYEGQLGAPLRA